jgi:hypothetical protein
MSKKAVIEADALGELLDAPIRRAAKHAGSGRGCHGLPHLASRDRWQEKTPTGCMLSGLQTTVNERQSGLPDY